MRDILSMRREPGGGSPTHEAPIAESRASKFAAGLRARLGSGDGASGGGGTGGSRFSSLRTRIMRGDLQTHTTDTAENSPVAPRLVRALLDLHHDWLPEWQSQKMRAQRLEQCTSS